MGSPVRTGIIGGAAVPHAPQLLTVPPTEDAAQVDRVRALMGQIGERFRALAPDMVIVISNDHGDDFILRSVPAFMFHCGDHAMGRDEHAGAWSVDGLLGYELVRQMQNENFDPTFTLDAPLGTYFTIPVEYFGYDRDTPIVPLFVNSYVAPQPRLDRCYAFGQALARAVQRIGRTAVIIASGGLSHYPGTARYASPGPDLAADEVIFQKLSGGSLRYLLSLDEASLDKSGNTELRAWLILAGALGVDRAPDFSSLEPNWHHTYGVLAWTDIAESTVDPLWYPATPSNRVELSRALSQLRIDPSAGAKYLDDREAFAGGFRLAEEERKALIDLEEVALRDGLGVHPLLVSGASRRIKLLQKKRSLE